MNRLLISGTNSGCGKTTVTCALLSALQARGITPTVFKSGPDYIDPMFHRAVTGVNAYNLDPFFLNGEGLRSHLTSYAGSLSVIEGAMGYYDGIATTDKSSAYTVAKETKTPVILVVSAKGVGHSISALLEGFKQHREDSQIEGVIFNHANKSRYSDLKKMAEEAGIQMYGTFPHDEKWALPSRHLGLFTAGEIKDLQKTMQLLGQQAEETIDIDGLLEIAKTASVLENEQPPLPREKTLTLAVAKDEAFCFLYAENLEWLQTLGCELVYFSPLKDKELPKNCDGLYLCGGYPELYKKELSDNKTMRESIKREIEFGLPTIAECGGFLYLHQTLDGEPMCNVIPKAAYKTKHLQRFGYITITAKHDNLLCKAGDAIRSHEFHYCESEDPGNSFMAQKAGRDINYACIHATDTLYAGFPHLYFPANIEFAKQFIRKMEKYESK